MKTIRKKGSVVKTILKWTSRTIMILLLIFFIWSLIPIKQIVQPIKPGKETKYWLLSDKNRIAYTQIAGDSSNSRHPIVYLHGGPGGYIHSSIIEQMKEISKSGYTIFLYDQIGSGLSDRLKKPKDYSFERHLIDLDEIISQHIKADKVIIIGHSYGAILATHFAAHYPRKVEKLILSSPGSLQPYRAEADGSITEMEKLYPTPKEYDFKPPINVFKETEKQQLQPRIIMSMLCALLFNRKWASDREFDDYTNMMASKFTKGMVADPKNVKPEEGGAGGYSHGFSNYYGNLKDVREQLKKLNIPTLVMQGQYDQGAYSDVCEYAELLKGKYIFIPNAGHIIWWDKPQEYVVSIKKFLSQQDVSQD